MKQGLVIILVILFWAAVGTAEAEVMTRGLMDSATENGYGLISGSTGHDYWARDGFQSVSAIFRADTGEYYLDLSVGMDVAADGAGFLGPDLSGYATAMAGRSAGSDEVGRSSSNAGTRTSVWKRLAGFWGKKTRPGQEKENKLVDALHPVPIPPTIWVLASGLVGLFGLKRRYSRN